MIHFQNIAGIYPNYTLFTNYKPTDFDNPNLSIDEFLGNYSDGYVFCFDDGSSYCSGLSSHDRFIYFSDYSTVVGTLSQTNYTENYYFNPYMTEMGGGGTTCGTGYHASGNTCVADTYTITYVLNGGTQASSGVPTSYKYGSSTKINGTPTKPGYTFAGWCTDSALTNCALTQAITSTNTGNKTFYAKWTPTSISTCPNYYGVPGGGTPSSLADCYTQVTAGQYVTSFSLPYNVSTNGSGDIGYNSYDNNKNSGDNLPTNTWFTEFEYGSLYGEAVCRYDSAATWAIATDYVYSKDDNQSAANCWCRLNSSYDSSPDLSYTSKWVYRGYVESCWDNCAESCASAVGAYWGFDLRQTLFSTVYPTFATCPANHYCPGGETQYGDTGAIACPTGFTSPAGSTSIDQCIPSNYSITYDYTNGGSGCDNDTYTAGTAKDLTCTPTYTGHTFLGWYTAATSGNKVTSITALDTGDKTLYAQWTANTYRISYELDNGSVGGTSGTNYTGAPTSYTYGIGAVIDGIPTITPSKHKFTGWRYEGGACSVSVTIPTTAIGNTLIEACTECNTGYHHLNSDGDWDCYSNTYTVSYDGNGSTGGSTESSSHTYGTAKALTTNGFTRTGYTFTGWNTAANGSGTSYTDGASVSNLTSTNNDTVTLYAQWEELPTWDLNLYVEGDIYDTITVSYDTDLSQLNIPEGDITNGRYYVRGYDGDIKDIRHGGLTVVCGESLYGTCVYDNHSGCKIVAIDRHDVDAEETCFDSIAAYDASSYGSSEPFIDWYDEGIIDVTANLDPTSYNLTYYDYHTKIENLTGNAPGYYMYGTEVTITARPPEKTGYTFAGWCTNDALTGDCPLNPVISATTTGDKEFYAKWIPAAEFTITTTNMDANSTFSFNMSAAGTFYVDWGDGTVDTINKTDTNRVSYTHTYTTAAVHTITMAGQATGYNNTSASTAAISFYNNKNIAAISGSLGAIFGTVENPAIGIGQPRFYQTFSGCTGLTSIPDGLFDGITGTPTGYMFYNTFRGCTGLTSIPANLFSGITGTPADAMFASTFSGCTGLTSIPTNLFSGITGTPATNMFYHTFNGCTGLQSYIPDTTFSGMEQYYKDNNLTYDAANDNYFNNIFNSTNLLTQCPTNMYQHITGFEGDWSSKVSCSHCPSATTSPAGSTSVDQCVVPTAHIIYNYPNGGSGCDNDTYTPGTDKDLTCIPIQDGYIFTGWYDAATGGNKVTSITVEDTGDKTFYAQWTKAEFTITTTNMDANSTFSFTISAAGTFYVDWGDGTVDTINKTDTNRVSYTHTYTTAGVHTITMAGQATGYSSGIYSYNAAISFSSNTNIAGISGSLGAIFGTVENPTVGIGQPMFYYTFISCRNLSSTIPEKLFDGIYGQPVPWMFTGTFERDSKLSGQIPENLFKDLEGYPVEAMFHSTFEGCSDLIGNIPAGLFSGIKGTPASSMYQDTFEDCTGLSGYIPYTLFSQLEGARKGNDFTYTMLNSGLDTSCPADMYQRAVPLGFNSLNGKAICDFCPEDTHSAAGSTNINQCYDSSYNIYYKYDNGGSGCVDDTYTTGEEKTLCVPTYTGHVFTGWHTEQQNGSKVEKILSTDTGDKTLYAHWQTQTSSCPYQYTKDNDLCLTSVTSGQCLVQNSIPTVPYDVSINGTGTFGARSHNQQTGTNPGNLDTNTFYLDFSYGTVYGEAHCSTTGAATQGTVTDANWSKGNEDNGGECWCRLTGDSNGYIQSPLKWAYWGHENSCWDWCTNQCAYFMQNTYDLRYGVFNLTGLQYTSCEAGYYCPNDKIMYNETGCRQETCPEGYTSDAGATSITQCYKTIQAGHSIDSNYQEILCPAGKYCPNEVKVYYNVTQTSEIEVSCPASYTSDAGATIKQNCYIIIQAGQYANCGYESATFDPNYQSEYWHKSSTASYPTDWNVNNNSWATIFYNNSVEDADRLYIQGRAACSNLQPNNIYGTFVDNEEVAFNPDTADGNYCWCNVDTPNGSEWINVYADYGERIQTYENATECWYRCAGSCGYQIRHVSEVRQTLCSLTERDTTSCPENYYCPGGTVYFGSTENNTIVPCPAGTTSPANSTSETQCVPAICSANEYKDQDVCKLCPNEWYSPEGSIGLGSCGRILHVGDDIVYLRSQKKTTPSLNFDFDGDGISDFFGNMTPIETNMHQNSTHKLKLNYNDQIMYLYDDTMEVQEQ